MPSSTSMVDVPLRAFKRASRRARPFFTLLTTWDGGAGLSR
jgi:hypothetical protein